MLGSILLQIMHISISHLSNTIPSRLKTDRELETNQPRNQYQYKSTPSKVAGMYTVKLLIV